MNSFLNIFRLFLLMTIVGATTATVGASGSGLAGIVAPGSAVEKVKDGFKDIRGPAFSRLGYLAFLDPADGKIWKYTPGGPLAGLAVLREEHSGAQSLSFDRQGRLLLAETGARRITRAERNGTVTVLAEKPEGRSLNGPVDVVHAIDGSTYFTDPAQGPGGASGSAVYQVMRDGKVRTAAETFTSASGLALSSDQQTLYVGDALAGRIHAFAIVGDGQLVNGRIFASLPAGETTTAGLRTDYDGNVYSTGPGGVWVFAPEGRHLGTIPVPVTPSGIAWGGSYRTLYITAGDSLYQIQLVARGTQTY